jgi:uncharacterized SAM-binding protein YcdF (DUF218 family)
MDKVDKYAKIIWDYMLMHHKLEPADIIFVLGSNDLRVADRAAELYKEKIASIVVCSGANGKASQFTEPEAKIFSNRMITLGVPKDKIILEPNSMNTGENVLFTKKLLEDKNILVKKILAVQKPYMERRTYATIKKQWPEVECMVTSPQISYEEYPNDIYFKDKFINTMVGDLIRVREYPKFGFQIEQNIPDNVWQAAQELIKLGYNKYAYILNK